jgi:hypothetical protein
MQKTTPFSFGKPLIKHISHYKKTLPIRKLMFVISSKAYLFYLQTYNFILISRGYVFHFRIIYTLLFDSNEFIPIKEFTKSNKNQNLAEHRLTWPQEFEGELKL